MSETPSAQQLAYAFIRDRIRAGQLIGGARVVPEEIAAELDISRMPVREAIRQLDAEGMLTIRPNRGAVVTELDADELTALFEMRSVLEGLAARRAVARLDEDAEDQLFLLLRRLTRVANGPVDAWVTAHDNLHRFVCDLASPPGVRNRIAAEAERLRMAVEPYLRLFFTQHEVALMTAQDHADLVAVLLTRDPDRAEAAMRHHVVITATTLSDFLRKRRQV